jgi:hypothetical protein
VLQGADIVREMVLNILFVICGAEGTHSKLCYKVYLDAICINEYIV